MLHLTSRAAPPEYLAFLRSRTISYLVSGESRGDLADALRKLKGLLGLQCLVTTAAGRLGGAMVRLGLVDEIHVMFAPIVNGAFTAPSLFAAPDLGPDEPVTQLLLLAVQQAEGGLIWLRYLVKGSAPQQG